MVNRWHPVSVGIVLLVASLACGSQPPPSPSPAPASAKTCCELYDAELQKTVYNWLVSTEACLETSGKPVDPPMCK